MVNGRHYFVQLLDRAIALKTKCFYIMGITLDLELRTSFFIINDIGFIKLINILLRQNYVQVIPHTHTYIRRSPVAHRGVVRRGRL